MTKLSIVRYDKIDATWMELRNNTLVISWRFASITDLDNDYRINWNTIRITTL